MTSHTIIRSASAILVGVIFALITAFVLLEDCLRHGAPFTTKHLMSAAVLGGSIYFGHKLWRQFKLGHYGSALGCAVLFIGGTSFCVLSSAGRNAEVVTRKVLQANSVNVSRDIAAKDVDEAKVRHTAAMSAEATECGRSQYTNACYTARAITEIRRKQYDDAKRILAKEKPLQVANADIRAAAELLSKLPGFGGSVESTEATLTLVFPFLLSLFCETASIVAFAMGLGHRVSEFPRLAAPSESQKELRKARTSDEQLVLNALQRAGRPLSNEELAEAMKTSVGEASKRRQVCEASGIIRTWREGRYLMIEAA